MAHRPRHQVSNRSIGASQRAITVTDDAEFDPPVRCRERPRSLGLWLRVAYAIAIPLDPAATVAQYMKFAPWLDVGEPNARGILA